jgi:hypothetical protein
MGKAQALQASQASIVSPRHGFRDATSFRESRIDERLGNAGAELTSNRADPWSDFFFWALPLLPLK